MSLIKPKYHMIQILSQQYNDTCYIPYTPPSHNGWDAKFIKINFNFTIPSHIIQYDKGVNGYRIVRVTEAHIHIMKYIVQSSIHTHLHSLITSFITTNPQLAVSIFYLAALDKTFIQAHNEVEKINTLNNNNNNTSSNSTTNSTTTPTTTNTNKVETKNNNFAHNTPTALSNSNKQTQQKSPISTSQSTPTTHSSRLISLNTASNSPKLTPTSLLQLFLRKSSISTIFTLLSQFFTGETWDISPSSIALIDDLRLLKKTNISSQMQKLLSSYDYANGFLPCTCAIGVLRGGASGVYQRGNGDVVLDDRERRKDEVLSEKNDNVNIERNNQKSNITSLTATNGSIFDNIEVSLNNIAYVMGEELCLAQSLINDSLPTINVDNDNQKRQDSQDQSRVKSQIKSHDYTMVDDCNQNKNRTKNQSHTKKNTKKNLSDDDDDDVIDYDNDVIVIDDTDDNSSDCVEFENSQNLTNFSNSKLNASRDLSTTAPLLPKLITSIQIPLQNTSTPSFPGLYDQSSHIISDGNNIGNNNNVTTTTTNTTKNNNISLSNSSSTFQSLNITNVSVQAPQQSQVCFEYTLNPLALSYADAHNVISSNNVFPAGSQYNRPITDNDVVKHVMIYPDLSSVMMSDGNDNNTTDNNNNNNNNDKLKTSNNINNQKINSTHQIYTNSTPIPFELTILSPPPLHIMKVVPSYVKFLHGILLQTNQDQVDNMLYQCSSSSSINDVNGDINNNNNNTTTTTQFGHGSTISMYSNEMLSLQQSPSPSVLSAFENNKNSGGIGIDGIDGIDNNNINNDDVLRVKTFKSFDDRINNNNENIQNRTTTSTKKPHDDNNNGNNQQQQPHIIIPRLYIKDPIIVILMCYWSQLIGVMMDL